MTTSQYHRANPFHSPKLGWIVQYPVGGFEPCKDEAEAIRLAHEFNVQNLAPAPRA